MSLALDDLPRDPEWLLQQLQQMVEVVATERSRNIALEIERDTVLAERDAARTERDLIREKHDAAQAEIEKLRLLIRQLQRGQFGRRSERLDPDLRRRHAFAGARIARHGRYVVFQLAEVAVPRARFAAILGRIDRLQTRRRSRQS